MADAHPVAAALRRAVDPPVMTPSLRLMWWLKFSFVGDAALAALGGLLVMRHADAGWFLLVLAGLRTVLGVVALLLAHRALEHRRPGDDRPSVIR